MKRFIGILLVIAGVALLVLFAHTTALLGWIRLGMGIVSLLSPYMWMILCALAAVLLLAGVICILKREKMGVGMGLILALVVLGGIGGTAAFGMKAYRDGPIPMLRRFDLAVREMDMEEMLTCIEPESQLHNMISAAGTVSSFFGGNQLLSSLMPLITGIGENAELAYSDMRLSKETDAHARVYLTVKVTDRESGNEIGRPVELSISRNAGEWRIDEIQLN